MEKSESIINLTTAVIKVMASVKGIDKTLNVGTGQNTYKGVADQEVKKTIGDAMEKNGLAIFPIGIEDSHDVADWEETYNGQIKRKQQVFVKVKTTYLLAHNSGEYIQIVGFGHGVDSQDKAAGKATTYALKYALLYTFMVATGKIDDADTTHSDDIQPKEKKQPQPDNRPMTELEIAIYDLQKTKSEEDVKTVWLNYPTLHGDATFKRETNRQKAKYQPELPIQ